MPNWGRIEIKVVSLQKKNQAMKKTIHTLFATMVAFRNATPKEWCDGIEAGIHTVYIGEVIGAWKR